MAEQEHHEGVEPLPEGEQPSPTAQVVFDALLAKFYGRIPPDREAAYFDEIREAVGGGAPTVLLGTSRRSLNRSLAKLRHSRRVSRGIAQGQRTAPAHGAPKFPDQRTAPAQEAAEAQGIAGIVGAVAARERNALYEVLIENLSRESVHMPTIRTIEVMLDNGMLSFSSSEDVGKAAVQGLIDLTNDSDAAVRLEAARALSAVVEGSQPGEVSVKRPEPGLPSRIRFSSGKPEKDQPSDRDSNAGPTA